MNILITGDKGYIGSSLTHKLKSVFNVTSINRDIVDLTDKNKVKEFFSGKYFDAVIHTAIQGGHRLIRDTEKIAYNNLMMFYNIIENKDFFGKFINFSSGAEKQTDTPYGLSKNIISTICSSMEDCFNLKLFAVFGESEIDTRFIKHNLVKYLSHEPMLIHKNKLMDFFYIQDLVKIVEYYLITDSKLLEKNIDCVYREKISLLEVADIINTCSDYKVDIVVEDNIIDSPYIGNGESLEKIPVTIGNLQTGISNMYRNLL